MAIEPVHCDSSSILKVLFFGTTCMFSCIYVCVCLSQAETLSPFSSRSESQVKIAKRLCVCAFVHVCVSLYLCLCLFVSAPSRLDLGVRWRLQNLFVSAFIYLFYYNLCFCVCIYVCVCLSQPLLVWIWESVEDCKTSTRVVSSEQGL